MNDKGFKKDEKENEGKSFRPLAIAELLEDENLIFLIPSYQRGYRWEEKQVRDLLDDIFHFASDESSGDSSYFLQPIVVQPCEVEANDAYKELEGKQAYKVLDGQQRLTTLLLILKRIMPLLGEEYRHDFEDKLYRIIYTNRPNLNLDTLNPSDSIDAYYLSNAKKIIDEWVVEKKSERVNLSNFYNTLLYNQRKQVKLIWYSIPEETKDVDGINIFNRLNKGKIALTISELIKALFILDFDHTQDSISRLASEQLSMEWNEMEKMFQNDSFWYFLSDDRYDPQTRMDLLFDFVTQKKTSDSNDFAYREFQKLFDYKKDADEADESNENLAWLHGVKSMQQAWALVKKTYDRLVAWYENSLFYHYVGYLITLGFSPLEIYNRIEVAKDKCQDHEWDMSDTKRELQRLIAEKLKIPKDVLVSDQVDLKDWLRDLEYGKDNYLILNLLLLFNIECYRKNNNVLFPFDKYKKGKWDIEHVDPQSETSLQSAKDRSLWLSNMKNWMESYLDEEGGSSDLLKECNDIIKLIDANEVYEERFKVFFRKVIEHFSSKVDGETESETEDIGQNKDSLGNLTLLDSSINREYKDAPFAYKRYCIIKYDREGERFIPMCTRNLFMKYYTNSTKSFSYLDPIRWLKSDQDGYLDTIAEVLRPIIIKE